MNHKLFWGSSYDRGLDIILSMWDELKAKYPDVTLDIAYGWDLFDKATVNNKERQEWKKKVQTLMDKPGITHHGRIGQGALRSLRRSCGIWVYPTYFTEIFCITAVECQNDGLVPVTMSLAALPETAKNGLLVEGEIIRPEVQEQFKKELFKLMDDKKLWEKMSHKCQKFARKFYWEDIARKWTNVFEQPVDQSMKVTIYTPTLRDGWWNVMSSNLAAQTYKNFEWIIIDGQEESRSKIADKYAREYALDIRYFHQGKTKRTYGLANANNMAIKAAKGELFVFLQDFVLITPTAIEELVNVSKKHPRDFIAPCDVYFAPKIQPDILNKEDWFNGNLDVIGEFMRKNIRIKNLGVRKADQLTDFEQNFGAVPTQTLRSLNGYWEFYDEALGWDDTEIIYRAEKMGIGLWIDDTNQAVCIDHHQVLGSNEGGKSVNRHRRLNDPRFLWMVQQMDKGNLSLVRDEELEKKIDLQYTIPEEVKDEDCVTWMRDNTNTIISNWKDI
jgi:GT2 family glycosyltransferase